MRKLFMSACFGAMLVGAGITTPGFGADLGGNCCADLEERLAELEATAARKGNRKVSLAIYGQVSEAIMWFDDGGEKNTFVNENSAAKNIVGFTGRAKINSDWFAGFKIEYQVRAYSSEDQNQLSLGASSNLAIAVYNTQSLALRHAYWQLGARSYGTVSVGMNSTATSELVLLDVGGIGVVSTPEISLFNGGMFLRNPNGRLTGAGGLASDGVGIVAITWKNLALGSTNVDPWDTQRRSVVRYDTPTIAGFTVTAAAGHDDFWDAALRYGGELGSFRLAAGIGYRRDTTSFTNTPAPASCVSNCDVSQSGWVGSASVMHVPSGLFLTGAGGTRTFVNPSLVGSVDNAVSKSDFYYVSGGISQKFFSLGKTAIYGEYTNTTDGLTHTFSDVMDSKVTQWGFGVVQNIDAAAMELFAAYKHYEGDFHRNNGTMAAPVVGHVVFKDFSTVMTGARIRF